MYANCGRFINAALEIQQRKADGTLPTDDPELDPCSHPAFPFEIPPPASAKQQQQQQQQQQPGRAKKQASNGTVSDTVKLTLAQWHALVSFWEHRLFVRARYVGLLFGFAAVVVGAASVVNNHWTSFHSEYKKLPVYSDVLRNLSAFTVKYHHEHSAATHSISYTFFTSAQPSVI